MTGTDMNKDEFESQRYSVLGDIWAHHNETQLQWPAVVVGVILIGLGTLLSLVAGTETGNPVSLWGIPRSSVVGTFFLIAGLITLLMVRTMRRARTIMTDVAYEMDTYEVEILRLTPEKHFSQLNHPKGISGPFLLALVLTVMGGLSGIAGAFLICSTRWAQICSVLLCVWALVEIGLLVVAYCKKPPLAIETSRQATGAGKN